MTRQEIDRIKDSLDARSWDGVPKYGKAFARGVEDAKFVLEICEYLSRSWTAKQLRKRLRAVPYLSYNKRQAYKAAIQSAMSMVDGMKYK